jgi:hypothetical protein
MNKKFLLLITCIALLTPRSEAQVLIHYWNFNNLVPTHTTPVPSSQLAPIGADYDTTALHGSITYKQDTTFVGVDSTYYDTVGGNILNAQLSAPAGNALRLRNPSTHMEARIYVPAGGYKDVIFNFGGETNNGPDIIQLSYSIDSGAHWLTAGIKSINGSVTNVSDTVILSSTWKLYSLTFDSSVNNKNGFVIRIQFKHNTTTNGYDAFDNITLMGAPYKAAIENIMASNDAIILYPNPASNSININTAGMPAEKTISIYNTTAQVVYQAITNGQQVNLPIRNIPIGIYYILIYEKSSGKRYVSKFKKE